MKILIKYVALSSACSTLVICVLIAFDLLNGSYRRYECAKEEIIYVEYNSLKVSNNDEITTITSDRHMTSKKIINHPETPEEVVRPKAQSLNFVTGSENTNSIGKVDKNFLNASNENLTLVTAFWDIEYADTKKQYEEFANVFKHTVNPLVVFTDSLNFRLYMNRTRKEFLTRTVIVIINKMSLWPFKLVQQIQSVRGQPVYPMYHPQAVYSTYASTQHVKYVSVAKAIMSRYFQTPYYAWIDLDYFRDIDKTQLFRINVPKGLEDNRIGMNIMNQNNQTFSTADNLNHDWISSAFIIGTKESFLKFEEIYHNAVLYFLDEELINTDQTILKSLYSEEGRSALKPDVELQLFSPKGYVNPRYYLGLMCIEDV